MVANWRKNNRQNQMTGFERLEERLRKRKLKIMEQKRRKKLREANKLREIRKQREWEKTKGKELIKSTMLLITKYKNTIDKFLDIAERKISIIDEYGDESWEELPNEVNNCLRKIAFKERVKYWIEKGEYIWSSKKFPILEKELTRLFKKYHRVAKKERLNRQNINISILSGTEFETFIANNLKEYGFDVVGTPLTGDQGADLIATKGSRKIIIQAKRYTGSVGNGAIQEVSSAIRYYGGSEAWVITNSRFTPAAIALAQKTGVRLVGGFDLPKLRELLN